MNRPLPITSKQRFAAFCESTLNEARPASEARSVDATGEGRRRRLRTCLDWLRPHRRTLALLTTLGLSSIAIDIIWPLVSRYLIDRVILQPGLPLPVKLRELVAISAGIAGLFVANSLFDLWRSFRSQLLDSRFSSALRARLFRRVLRLPMAEVNELKTGGVLSRLSSDVDHTTGLLQTALINPLLSAVRLIATLSVIFLLDWRIAAAVVLAAPPIVIAQNVWLRRSRQIWKSMGQDRSEIDARVSEGLNGLRVVRGFARERREESSFLLGQHTVIRKLSLATNTQRRVALVWDLVMPLTQITILGFGGYLVLCGQTTVGTLMAFQGYLLRLIDPITELVKSNSETQRGLAALERVCDLLDKPPEKPDRPRAVEAPPRVREIHINHVYFGYRKDMPVIRDFELRVPGGSVVALVGASGAGKTTLTDLVARFHDPSSGRIRLNGIDLRDIRLQSYRKLLGIVQQDTFLFDGSVRDNIAYGKSDATQAEIEEAARLAHAHEFISRLPEGYDTMVGERGVKLSGGQRQRLSIARAFLAAPQILILDEATSNLDTESEQLIQASMQRLLQSRTTFIIAHRLSTIRRADIIVVMQQGEIAEVGDHDSLLRRGGIYASMLERQFQNGEREPESRRAIRRRSGSRADAE
ncbi:MAG TPA: ABC transporter ATP-binding protein [Polyangiaceae bacterium]|nr:ABC transporter ATP-binding protein [Polyangiaceae bacterium]